MPMLVFEDEKWRDFAPLSTTRHVSEQLLGPCTLYGHLASKLPGGISFLGREYLGQVTRERTGVSYNVPQDGMMVNGRLNPLKGMRPVEKVLRSRRGVALIDRGDVAAISVRAADVERAQGRDGTFSQVALMKLARGLERLDARDPLLFSYPWEVLASNGEAIVAAAGRPKGGLAISPDARVEELVSFDTRSGPVVIEGGAEVEALSRLAGPCYIGGEAKVLSARIRGGTTVGMGAKVGGELEHAILYPHSNKAHDGYVADSIIGEWVNVGAGATTSNLKNTYGTIRVWRGRKRVESRMNKLGTVVGDMAKISIGTLVYAGKTIGVGAQCAGTIDSDVPDFAQQGIAAIKDSRVRLDSVLETQERMKARRGLKMSEAERTLVRYLYKASD